MRTSLSVKDCMYGLAGACITFAILPDPGDITRFQIIIGFIYLFTLTIVCRWWLLAQIEKVRAKRESLRISRRQKVVDIRLHRPVYIHARKVFEQETL